MRSERFFHIPKKKNLKSVFINVTGGRDVWKTLCSYPVMENVCPAIENY